MTRHEIQILRGAGVPQATVAKTAASIRSVRRIEAEAPYRRLTRALAR